MTDDRLLSALFSLAQSVQEIVKELEELNESVYYLRRIDATSKEISQALSGLTAVMDDLRMQVEHK